MPLTLPTKDDEGGRVGLGLPLGARRSALGLEAPSPSYIAWQGCTGAQVLLSMGRIQRAARRILAAAEKASPRAVRGA